MPLDNSGQHPTEGDQKPSLPKTVKRFAKALAKIALGALIRSQADVVDLKDIAANIGDLFSDLDVEKETADNEEDDADQ